MSNKFSYENLETFNREWQKLLKEKPENLILSMNFRNLIIHSHRRLSKDKKKDVFKYSVKYLRNIVQNKSPEIIILSDHIEEEYLKKIKGGKYSEIEPILEKIESKLSGELYLNFLIDKLELSLFESGAKKELLSVIAELIIAELLNKCSSKQLQNTPGDILSNGYTKLIINSKKDEFLKNKYLESELYATIEYLFNKIDINCEFYKINHKTKNSILELIPTIYWKRDVYSLFEEIKESLIKISPVIISKLPEGFNITDIATSRIYEDEIILKELRNVYPKFLRIIIKEIIRNAVDTELNNEEQTQLSIFLNLLCDNIDSGDFINLKIAYTKDKDEKNPAIIGVIKDILPFLLGGVIAQIVIEKTNIEDQMISDELVKIFVNEFLHIYLNEKDETIKEKSEYVIYNQINLEKIGTCLTGYLNKLNINIGNINKNNVSNSHWFSFSKLFLDKFILNFGKNSNFNNLPWKKLEKSELHTILSNFLRRLNPPEIEWNVVFVIDNIVPEGNKWKFGNVLFYDPEIWDFGEGFYLFSYMAHIFPLTIQKGNKTFAKVAIKSESQYKAKQIGFDQVQKALDTMTFAHSVSNTFGMNPTILNFSFITKKGNGIGGSFNTPKSSFATCNKAVGDKIIEYSKSYSPLLEIQHSNPAALNELQRSFLKAVGWYRKGRWEEDYLHAFIDYWIALEHIFAEGHEKKSEILLKKLPKLHLSWRNTPRAFFLSQYLRQIFTFIEQNNDFKTKINSDLELKGWDKHDYILLNPKNLEKIISYSDIFEVKEYIQRIIDEELTPGQIENYKIITEALREEFKFKVLILNSIRNDIVHSASNYYPNMNLYFEIIKGIIEGILLKMFDEAADTSSKCTTVDDLILELQKPF